jgi:hypothetical protein
MVGLLSSVIEREREELAIGLIDTSPQTFQLKERKKHA